MELDLAQLKGAKNLLAFSAGVDSSALFYLLVASNIEFDLAIVDYNVRAQSKEEIKYAKKLATEYGKKLYIKEAAAIEKNFEHNARAVRYEFFESLIKAQGYEQLITAHQLDDMFEWFMMQLSRGAGLHELLGFESVSFKNGCKIVKPLLYTPKEQLQEYLEQNGYRYFVDSSNSDEKYKRNYFRNRYTKNLLKEFQSGIQKSFQYLHKDKALLSKHYCLLYTKEFIRIYSFTEDVKEYLCAKTLKEFGYVMSAKQRKELYKPSVVIGAKYAVGTYKNLLFISKYSSFVMDKKQKELCRVAKIPKHCRPYLCEVNTDLIAIKALLSHHTT